MRLNHVSPTIAAGLLLATAVYLAPGCDTRSVQDLIPPFLRPSTPGVRHPVNDSQGPGFTHITDVTYDSLAIGEPVTLRIGLRALRGAYDLRYEVYDGVPNGDGEQLALSEQWTAQSGSTRLEKDTGDDKTFAVELEGPLAPGVCTLRLDAQPADDNPAVLGSGPVDVTVVVDYPAVTDHDVQSWGLLAADGVSIETRQALVEEYAPVLRLAADEAYHPQSVDTALAHARLRVDGVLADWESGSASRLINTTTRLAADVEFEATAQPDPSGAAYYASLHRTERGLAIGYWSFYLASNWKDFAPAGNTHQGDWESVTILLDAPAGEPVPPAPTRIALAQHETFSPTLIQTLVDRALQEHLEPSKELADRIVEVLAGGEVADWESDAVQRVGNHPVLYVGLGSHATYFAPGLRRFLCGAVDTPTGDGTVILPPGVAGSDLDIDPSLVLPGVVMLMPSFSEITPDSPFAWMRFSGHWGKTNDSSDGTLADEASDDTFCAFLSALGMGNDGPRAPWFQRHLFGDAPTAGLRWLDPHARADQLGAYP